MDKICNKEIRSRAKVEPVEKQIEDRKLEWYRHVLKKDKGKLEKYSKQNLKKKKTSISIEKANEIIRNREEWKKWIKSN